MEELKPQVTNIQEIDAEMKLEFKFMKSFKTYLITIRANTVFVYPDSFNIEHFPCYIIQYRKGETLFNIYDTFRVQFMSQHYRSYQENFTRSSLQALLSSMKLSYKNFVFNNQGPIDMIVSLQAKPVEYRYRGHIIKPLNLVGKIATI